MALLGALSVAAILLLCSAATVNGEKLTPWPSLWGRELGQRLATGLA